MNNDIRLKMENLIERLNSATVAYDAGYPIMSDKDWDDLYFELVQLESKNLISLSNSPTMKVNWEPITKLEKITHNHPMLSLAKTKDVNEVERFIGNKKVVFMAKMDGLTCSLRYLNGRLISAETRGNGEIGEDVTRNVRAAIRNVPLNIPIKEEVIIDGEIISDYENFEKFKNDFANPRNFAAGGIRCLDPMECAEKGLFFIAWDMITNNFNRNSLFDKLSDLDYELNFDVAPSIRDTAINENIDLIKSMAQDKAYPIDGVVIKYDDCNYYESLGRTEHHFNGGLAFKFYDEEYETTLNDIEWTMGRTGVLTPVAIFEPLDIEGTIVERASLHNMSIMKSIMGEMAWEGQRIKVFKSNMIIPQISWAEDDDEYTKKYISIPECCPICGKPIEVVVSDSDVENLMCVNPTCEGKLLNQVEHFCGKKGLDIKGISKATIEKLIDWGWLSSINDIFDLKNHREEWVKKSGFGEKSVDKILDAIELGRRTTLAKFISAIGIPLIGSTYAKTIANELGTWYNFRDAIESKETDFSNIDGFGPEMNYSLKHFNYEFSDSLIENEVVIIEEVNSNNLSNNSSDGDNKLDGLTFVITGKIKSWKNRDELKAAIEARGGKVAGSVSSKTNYLINNDSTSTSAKNESAKKLGVTIITEEEFKNLFDF